MWGLVSWVFYTVWYSVLDLAVYVLVDVVAKSPLREASDDDEKRQVWLYEAIVLVILSLVIWQLHHTPFILLILACLTLIYSQLRGRVNFRYFWLQLATNWEECQQHEESIKKLREMSAHHVTLSPGPPKRWLIPGQVPPPVPFDPTRADHGGHGPSVEVAPSWCQAEQERWIPPVTVAFSEPGAMGITPIPRNRGPMMPHSTYVQTGPVYSTPMYSRLPDYMVPNQQHSTSYMMPNHQPPASKYTPVITRRADLARPSIHSYLDSPKHTPLSFKSKVLSAFGMNPFTNVPPGLGNNRENLCFFNSVLQCLSHSPGLVQCLAQATEKPGCTDAERGLFCALTELLHKLVVKPGTTDVKILEPFALREAASSLPGSMVTHPIMGPVQTQQDAAEFLMWLLDALHGSLNTGPTTSNNHSGTNVMEAQSQLQRHPGSPRYTYVTLNMLSFIYGDLTPQRITELKAACRKEIEKANGLDNDSYAEPIQRLSDLEWLTYKEQNNSAVDDLFTGQLVEAQHCLACNRISIGIQTFNILPVPVVEPRDFNGLVYLEDCFTKFGNIEDLFGPDGLRCECSNKAQLGGGLGRPQTHLHTPVTGQDPVISLQGSPTGASPILPNGGARLADLHRRRLAGSDSAVQMTMSATVMSPIAGSGEVFNDSGFQDHQFKTSTPINQRPGMPIRLTDGQRRSLLRQLPECLVVQLMRFSYQHGEPRKIMRPVSIPLVNMDMTHLIADNVMRREDLTALNACFVYNLCGLCLHLGGEATSFGHYVAYAQAADQAWYKYDDDKVTAVNMAYELNTKLVRENAYLLFYRKSF